MRKTTFAGITALEAGESLTVDGGAFTDRDRDIIDRLLRVGARSHRHDGHARLGDPTGAPTIAASATGGALPADLTLSTCYTLVDADGGETLPSPIASVTTAPSVNAPTDAPTAVVDNAAGGLLARDYAYLVTLTDGMGGETTAGPPITVTRDPGPASAQVMLSGLQAIVATSPRATGWRLYRADGGGTFSFLAAGTLDTFVDDGAACDCGIQPPATNTTGGTSSVRITVPPGIASAAAGWRLYVTPDGDFTTPSLVGATRAPATASAAVPISALALAAGQPPDVSTAIAGAAQINPDTDLLDWHWKRPVATPGALPPAGNANGDVRVVLSDHSLRVWTGGSWQIVSGSGGGSGGVAPLVWRGAWDPASAYVTDDLVSYQGSTYRASEARAVADPPPTDGGDAFWPPVALHGAPGIPGTNGADGAGGLLDVWHGAWDGMAAYASGDVVRYQGSSWMAQLNVPAPSAAPGGGGFVPITTSNKTAVGQFSDGVEMVIPVLTTATSPTGTAYKGEMVQFEVAGPGNITAVLPVPAGTGSATTDLQRADGTPVSNGWMAGTFTIPLPAAGMYALFFLVPGTTAVDLNFHATLTSGTATIINATGGGGPATPNNPPTEGATWTLVAQRGADGAPAMHFAGTYDNALSYAINDTVAYAGSSYAATAAIPPGAALPNLNAAWQLVALAGVKGDKGDPGTPGSGGSAAPGHVILNTGVALPQRTNLAFGGADVTDSPFTDATEVDVRGAAQDAIAAASPAANPISEWVPLTLTTDATDASAGGAGYAPAVKLDSSGIVHLRGRVNMVATTRLMVAALGDLYRPGATVRAPHAYDDDTTGTAVIGSDGSLTIKGKNGPLFLDGISFPSLLGEAGVSGVEYTVEPTAVSDPSDPLRAFVTKDKLTIVGTATIVGNQNYLITAFPRLRGEGVGPTWLNQAQVAATYTITDGPFIGQTGTVGVRLAWDNQAPGAPDTGETGARTRSFQVQALVNQSISAPPIPEPDGSGKHLKVKVQITITRVQG